MSSSNYWASSLLATGFGFLGLTSVISAQTVPDWGIMTAPSELAPFKKTDKKTAIKPVAVLNAPETTQSITTTRVPPELNAGWNLSSDPVSASLIFAHEGKSTLVGFTCKKGDGFVTFRSSPTASFAANKHVLVTLKSLNGAIRIEAKTNEIEPRLIESEVPIRTSSLVFVLSPKKGDITVKIGGFSEKVMSSSTDTKLLRFQSLCDQPLIGAAEE